MIAIVNSHVESKRLPVWMYNRYFFFSERQTEKQVVYCLKKTKDWCLWLCGLHFSQQSTKSREDENQQLIRSLDEKPRVKLFLNINFGILVAVGIGLFGYFTIDPFPAGINPRTYQVA